jgi:hypothetical protein
MKRIKMEPSLTPRKAQTQKEKKSMGSFVSRLIKLITVHGACFCLITMPSVQAQSTVGQALQGAIGIIQGGMNAALQQQQQMLAQQQLQAQMASLQPRMVPSKYHPQCAVAQAVTDFPEGACNPNSPPQTPQEAQEAAAFRELAVSYESFFQNLLAESQNSPRPVGVQCIEEANKQTDAQLQDKINGLQALINQVKKEAQLFEQNQQKLKEEMDKNRDILYGNKSNNAETLNTDYLAEFTPACQTFYKNSGQTTILRSGFTGLRNNSETMKNQAGTFENNRQAYIDDINNQLTSIRNGIKQDGLSSDLQQNIERLLTINGSTFQFGSANALISAKVSEFQKKFEIIQRDLQAVGFNVTADDLNGDFNERMSRFAEGAGAFFKKEAINDCVNGRGSTGIGLSTNQILQGLRHRRSSGSATTLDWYRTALNNILSSDAFIEDKMIAIQRLDKRLGVGEVLVQVQGADGNSRSVTPYDLYKQQIEVCEARISQDDTFSTVDGLRDQGGSVAERIQDAERALRKGINLEKNFAQELSQAMFDRVVNCDGIQKSEEKCMPGESGALPALDTTDGQFCVAHATSCANQAKSCYAETDTIVKKRQQQMKTLAAGYNERVSALIAKQEFFLNQIKAQVIADAEFIKRFLPGTSYAFPEDLFVKMPQEKIDPEYGVAIAGDINDISNLTEDLPRKLGSLKKMLEGQQQRVAAELGQYLQSQRQGMSADAGKWSELKGKCESSIQAFNQMMAQQQQQQGEEFGKSQAFCQKYNAAASAAANGTNPAAGCGVADDLASEAFEVAAGLANPTAIRQAALEFQAHCEEANNEGEERDDDERSRRSVSDRDFQTLARQCGNSTSDDTILGPLVRRALRGIPDGISSDDERRLRDIINGETGSRSLASIELDLSDDIYESSYYRNLVEPIKQIREASFNALTLSDTVRERLTDPAIRNLPDGITVDSFAGEGVTPNGVCHAYNLSRVHAALEDAGGENTEDRQAEFDEGMDRVFTASSGPLAEAAGAVANARRTVAQSESGRIGERLNGVPCMAQQGFNGSQGFDISNFDLGILGAQGFDTINALTR